MMKNHFLPSKISLTILAGFASGMSASAANIAGVWSFNDGSAAGKATIGQDLAFGGTAPSYSASLADDGGGSLNGVITTSGPGNTITATHGIAPNGGGSFVNQYSIVADLFSPVGSRSSWRTIYQTNTGNSNDGDYFIRNSDSHLGVSALTYSDNPIDNTAWNRLVITVDLASDGNDVLTYLNGSLFHTHAVDEGVDGRFSLDPTVLFFSDNDGDDAAMNVGDLAIYDGVLTPGEVSGLGGAGNAIAIPEPGSSVLLLVACAGLLRRRR